MFILSHIFSLLVYHIQCSLRDPAGLVVYPVYTSLRSANPRLPLSSSAISSLPPSSVLFDYHVSFTFRLLSFCLGTPSLALAALRSPPPLRPFRVHCAICLQLPLCVREGRYPCKYRHSPFLGPRQTSLVSYGIPPEGHSTIISFC